jgi:hypothetical protein
VRYVLAFLFLRVERKLKAIPEGARVSIIESSEELGRDE